MHLELRIPGVFALSLRALALAACLAAAFAAPAVAAPRLAPVFGDHMVVQRDVALPVWGWADPGEAVSVSFKGQSAATTADAQGRWRVDLPATPADARPAEMIVAGTATVTLRDVLVGEVWLASGQSNMAWTVNRSANAEAEIAAARFPLIRELAVRRTASPAPQREVEAAWAVCSPETVSGFSAVGYFFARKLHQELGVPVAILHSSWGGTPVEAWIRREAMVGEPRLIDIFARWERALGEYPEKQPEFAAALAAWEKARDAAAAAGQAFTERRPQEPRGPLHYHRPANLFNAMIHPLIPAAIRGAIWYQGEGNARNPEEYAVSFPLMIRDWRQQWGAGDFPFYFVQLAAYKPGGVAAGGTWPWLRQSQAAALELPNTGMAVTIDIGEPDDIHPKNKQDVGDRLARLALRRTYGRQAVVDSGPVFQSMKVRGRTAELLFAEAGGSLAIAGEGPLKGFTIAGADKVFHSAEATLSERRQRRHVTVSSPAVPTPVAVRYAWDNCPTANLANTEGLPAAPFRTDDWPREGAN